MSVRGILQNVIFQNKYFKKVKQDHSVPSLQVGAMGKTEISLYESNIKMVLLQNSEGPYG